MTSVGKCLACVALALIPLPVAAQRVSLGAAVGGNRTVYTSRSSIGEHRMPSAQGTVTGAAATLALSRHLGIRGEALLVERVSAGGIELRIMYYELPVLAVLTPGGRLSDFSLLLGSSYARERRCSVVAWEVSGIPEDPAPARPRTMHCDLFRTNLLNVGYTGGLQYARQLAWGSVRMEWRVTQGRSDLTHDLSCCSVRTRTQAIVVGYSVPIVR